METTFAQRVRDVVTGDHRAAAVFEAHSIDFCCNGEKTIGAACAEKGIDPERVVRELESLGKADVRNLFRPAEWELGTLADFIVDNHHRYVRRMIPLIQRHLEKVVAAHGANHPEVADIAQLFGIITEELTQHMMKEETVLFPAIRAISAADSSGRPVQQFPFVTIRNPIHMMELEHRTAGDVLLSIRRESAGYALPADACTTYKVTYEELQEFERDLHQHVHLENNILFPRAIELESRLRSAR